MNASRLLGQVIIVLTGVIMAVAAAFFLLDQFVYPYKMADINTAESPMMGIPAATISDTATTGVISKVTIDEMATLQKALVTIQTPAGETKQISLPADSRQECTKIPTVTIEELQIGATITVSGDESENGMIEPCKHLTDDFTVKTS
jgi:hypothetical protein